MIITILKNIFNYTNRYFFQGILFSFIFVSIYLFFKIRCSRDKQSESFTTVFFVKGEQVKELLLFAALMFYIYIVLGITLFSRSEGYTSEVNLRLFSTFGTSFVRRMYVYENILLFIPLAVLLYLLAALFRRAHWAFLTGFSCSVLIEFTQYVTHWGKLEIDDVFNNVVGMMIGYFCCRFVSKNRIYRGKR